MGKDASYYETLHNYHEALVKHSGVVKAEDFDVDNYQKDRFFIDAPNNQIIHASLHRIANGDARSWEIAVHLYPFQLVREARSVANSAAAFFRTLTTANCGVSMVDSTMESFLLLFTEYFMSIESNFEELTEQTYHGLCICTNCDHAPKPLKLTNKESIRKAVTSHACASFSISEDCVAISVAGDAFCGADFHSCVFVVAKKKLGWLTRRCNVPNPLYVMTNLERYELLKTAIRESAVIAVNFIDLN